MFKGNWVKGVTMTNSPQELIRFLLVEDDDDHAQIVFRSLRDDQVTISIEHVKDGVEALAFLRNEGPYIGCIRPDVILLDLKLPKMDGHGVLAAIKEDLALREIPVVVLTTSDAEADMVKAYQSHANSYLVKPLDAASFRRMVEELRIYWGMLNRVPKRSSVLNLS
jgi:CheY-like chemotaxis protein